MAIILEIRSSREKDMELRRWLSTSRWLALSPTSLFSPPRQSFPSSQEMSRATHDMALGWAVRWRLGLPGVSLLHVQPFLNFLNFFLVAPFFFFFFWLRKLECQVFLAWQESKLLGS